LLAKKVTPSKLITHRFSIDDALTPRTIYLSAGMKNISLLSSITRSRSTKPAAQHVEMRAIENTNASVSDLGRGNFAKKCFDPQLRTLDDIQLAAFHGVGRSARKPQEIRLCLRDDGPKSTASRSGINTIFITTRHDTHAGLLEALKREACLRRKAPCVKPEQLFLYEKPSMRSR